MKMVICDSLPEHIVSELRALSAMEVFDLKRDNTRIEALYDVLEAVVVRSATQVDADFIAKCPNLKLIARAGMGIDNVDVERATQRGIVVMNTPARNSIAAAELALGLMFAVYRHISQSAHRLKMGQWDRAAYMGKELTGKTLGIIGYGNVGRELSKRAQGLMMNVVAYDPFVSTDEMTQTGFEAKTLQELLHVSDIVSVHASLTPETKDLFDRKSLAKMKEGAILINTARGDLIDESALCEAIDNGPLAGAGLDVFKAEPLAADHPFLAHPHIVCTPHLGASTREAQEQVGLALVEQIMLYLEEELVLNGVNVPYVPKDVLLRMGKIFSLAEKLGRFVGETLVDLPQEIRVGFQASPDNLTHKDAVVSSVLLGILKHTASQDINFVNAPVEIKRRGVKVEKIESDKLQRNTIYLACVGKSGENEYTATLNEAGVPILRSWNKTELFLPLNQNICLIKMAKSALVGAWQWLKMLSDRHIEVERYSMVGLSDGVWIFLQGAQDFSEVDCEALRTLPEIEQCFRMGLADWKN